MSISSIAPAFLILFASAGAGAETLAVRRYFEAVPAFGITHACVVEADPRSFVLRTLGAAALNGRGKVLLAAVYPVRTVADTLRYMESEGCIPEKTSVLDGGGSTQMSFWSGGRYWNLGWERRSASVPECHLRGDNRDARCYRPVGNFIVLEKRKGKHD